jgi:dihydroflavonol-4-reductase
MTGADVVIHNAGLFKFGITQQEYMTMRAVNINGTEHTLGLALELGIPKIVYTSSILAFGQTGDIVADESFQRQTSPLSYTERTKTEAHEFAVELQKRGAPIVIACPAPVTGPGNYSGLGCLLRMYVRGFLPPVLFAPEGRSAHVYLDDVAEGIVRCAEFGRIGETYILSNGVMKHRDMFNLWKQTSGGSKTTVFWMPYKLALLFNIVAEPIERLLGLPILFCREFVLYAFGNWQFSAAKAERELGMHFRTLEQAWIETLQRERENARKGQLENTK